MNISKSIVFSITLIIGVSNSLFAQKKTSIDSLKQSIEQIKEVQEKLKVLKSKPFKVKVINTCSTKPENCGITAFGSVSLVQILEGEYIGESIYVASACSTTYFLIGKTYKLSTSYEPGFSVHLCNGKFYNSDWNYNLDDNEHFIVFGSLNSILTID